MRAATWRRTRGDCQNPWPRAVSDRLVESSRREVLRITLRASSLALSLSLSRRRVDHPSLGSLTEREEPYLDHRGPRQPKTQPFCRTLQTGTKVSVSVTEVVVGVHHVSRLFDGYVDFRAETCSPVSPAGTRNSMHAQSP